MAIESTVNELTYVGNNSTSIPYPVTFRFDKPEWLSVARIDEDGVAYALLLGSGFSISGTSLRTVVAIPPAQQIKIVRNAPALQTMQSFTQQDSYKVALEAQLDRTTMAVQDLARNSGLEAAQAILDQAALAASVAANYATDANASANNAEISAGEASDSADSAAASAVLAQSASPIPPGPYATAQDAIAAGVQFGRTFFKPDFSAAVARYRASTVQLFGDSIMNFSTSYVFSILQVNGSNFGLRFQIRATVPNPHLISIQQVNSGANQTLLVTYAANKMTIRLATDAGGVITSTSADVKAAVIAAQGDKFIVLNTYGPSNTLSVATAETWAFDESYNGPNAVWIWLQALLGQRFDLTRRKTKNGYQEESGTEGDWDFGYPSFRAYQLLANPGPMGDLLAQSSDLIVGMAGTNDIFLDSAPAATVAARIGLLWDALVAAKRQFIWMEIPPHGVAITNSLVDATNALLRPAAIARGITLLPWDPSLVSGGAALPQYFDPSDPTHPNTAACYKQALYILSAVDGFIQPTAPVYTNPADGIWLTGNPTLTGSASGVATNWVNNSPSLITPTKNGGDQQILTVAQSPGTYAKALFSSPFATTGWAVGDLVEGVFSIDVSASGLDMKGLEACLYFAGVSSNPSTSAMKTEDYDPLRFAGTSKPGIYTLRTPPSRIPHGATGVAIALQPYGSGTIKIIAGGVRKSTQPY
ncbi:MAG: hydrolase family protein [Akkermansiaceae bacterium]|nr:hydrolase family protein [Akkermansiaceae bacterium]